MRSAMKLTMVLATLVAGWGILIWMQWVKEFDVQFSIIGMPIAMLLMAFLAVLAVNEGESPH